MTVDVEPKPTDDVYARARKRAEDVQGLLIHLFVYAVVNTGLFVINLGTTGGDGPWWFIWPLIGWGIGVVIHIATTVVPVFSSDWVDRRADRLVGRNRSGDR